MDNITKFCLECKKEIVLFKKTGRPKKFCSDMCRKKYFASRNDYFVRYYEKHKDKLREYGREYGKMMRAINPDKQKESTRKWCEKNPDVKKQSNHIRRSRELKLPSNFTSRDWKLALEYFEGKCAYCGEVMSEPHREHFIPVTKGGGYTKDNIVPACRKCNSGKRDKNPLDWLVMQARGFVAYVKVVQYLEGFAQ